MTLQHNALRLTLAEPIPELDALADSIPDIFPIEGEVCADKVETDDYLHDPFAPGRVLHREVMDSGVVYFRVWTRGPFQEGPLREIRFGRRPDEKVLVTRLVDENLEKA